MKKLAIAVLSMLSISSVYAIGDTSGTQTQISNSAAAAVGTANAQAGTTASIVSGGSTSSAPSSSVSTITPTSATITVAGVPVECTGLTPNTTYTVTVKTPNGSPQSFSFTTPRS